ncbi:hypothetical protein NHX12_018935 [Muraenolepis orangiensis]|uniref:Scaffolding anchor of CK1 domain-containing protein n=1 Tax=Muraenolepis orangiensis TaxID=630683 RepID=A0A9Q0IYC7_9TELE|nr:hypothetical protein NHX12_018935 [Muraenolepis orangiensis]
MAESQLVYMEDGKIHPAVPETKPEFYYSETQRAAIEELLRNGDGAFKTRLKDDNVKDFLSAREIKTILRDFKEHTVGDAEVQCTAAASPSPAAEGSAAGVDSGVHSTYWPQVSDTDVPPLDIGWPGGGFFRGVTRVAVHTHPPKDQGPHIKEVVRRLIQEAGKVVAIVMDLLTDLHILQDLMEAASGRSVPVYILLDAGGVPHFLDMCSRLQLGAQHLKNIRSRCLRGAGLSLSCGTLPGSLSNKYMLVDGDKVVFGSYSFAWSSSRLDRNMITVMSGQVVEAFDRDFRELYAVSEPLDLYQELHVARPSNPVAPPRPKLPPKRLTLPATTSRFQMSLGDSLHIPLQVPAHKYHNPKYQLALGDMAKPSGGGLGVSACERLDHLGPLPSEEEEEEAPSKVNVEVVAIVMDLLTDLHILQDLMEAASCRSVPVYILLDAGGVPHFLDMCSRLQLGAQHLKNIRSRCLRGAGLSLSCGTLPGSLSNKYMLVDGDKVVFGSYSFAWSSSRLDRNMITVMSGQVVEAFDRDFRELYAVSEPLDLYQELHVARPSNPVAPPRPKLPPKRLTLPATTSRFQMSLGDSLHIPLQVPTHKYHNPKYQLALGDMAKPSGGGLGVSACERLDHLGPLPSEEEEEEAPSKVNVEVGGVRKRSTLRERLWKGRGSVNASEKTGQGQGPSLMEEEEVAAVAGAEVGGAKAKSAWRWRNKKSSKSGSMQTINTADNQSTSPLGLTTVEHPV